MFSFLQQPATNAGTEACYRICHESFAIIQRVHARLISLSPDRSDDDLWWVWYQLAKKYPQNVDYDYTNHQIHLAWRIVRRMRRRHDLIGAGGPRREARRQRSKALRSVARDVNRPLVELLRIDMDDYNPYDATLAIADGNDRCSVKLSPLVREVMQDWLRLRGHDRGRLFDLPSLPEFWEEPLPQRPTRPAGVTHVRESFERELEEEDSVECICRGQGPLARAYVLQNVSDKCGDWSTGFTDRLTRRAGDLADHSFSVYDRRKCRTAMSAAAARLSNGNGQVII